MSLKSDESFDTIEDIVEKLLTRLGLKYFDIWKKRRYIPRKADTVNWND